ncbi:hypothetical protein C0J52_04007 [Blattella germanica]|nr:hypothetical protein C0J52_04007 [Blattella germanica]
MKPSSWYASTLVVVFFYIYVLAVQYVRAQEAEGRSPSTGKITFEDESHLRSVYAQEPSNHAGSIRSDASPSIYANDNVRSVGVGSSSDVSPSLYPSGNEEENTDSHREVGIGSPTYSDNSGVTSYSSYPSEAASSYLPENTGSLRSVGVGSSGMDRAVGNNYRPGYSYDPSYNSYNSFPSASDAVPAASGNVETLHQDSGYTLDFNYHNYEKLTKFLRTTSSKYPNLTALYSIGKSVQGRDLWVMVVSASPYEHMIGKPDVKYVANMHGNEAYLVTSYNSDPYIKWLLDNTRIHILPSMNPDGFEVAREGQCDGGQGRYNARGFDLNRNFPDYFKQNNKRGQPETDAVKEWISKIQFVLSGGLHGGALVASYPFDNTPNSRRLNKRSQVKRPVFHSYSSTPSLTPDDDVFKHLALTYSNNHPVMSRGKACKAGTPSFNQGITNGAAWWNAGLQLCLVWVYGSDVRAFVLQVSFCVRNSKVLGREQNEAHRGVHGFVMDENGNPVEKASLKVKSRDVYADGYLPREIDFMVVEQHPTLLNVTLHPAKVYINIDEISIQLSVVLLIYKTLTLFSNPKKILHMTTHTLIEDCITYFYMKREFLWLSNNNLFFICVQKRNYSNI